MDRELVQALERRKRTYARFGAYSEALLDFLPTGDVHARQFFGREGA